MANDFVIDFESSMKSFEKKWILLKGNVWHRKMEYYPKVELNERYRKKNTFSFPSHRDDCLIFLPSYTCNPMHNRCSFRKDWALFKAEAVKAKPIFQLRIISPGLTQIKLNKAHVNRKNLQLDTLFALIFSVENSFHLPIYEIYWLLSYDLKNNNGKLTFLYSENWFKQLFWHV